MHPFRLYVHHTVTLFQEKNVRRDFRPRIFLKRRVRKSDRAQKLRPLCEVFAHFGAFLVHRALACDKSDNAAGAHPVQRFCEKIIMD